MKGANRFPKIHNAMWPGLVGKGQGSEPIIDLDTMLDLTAAARAGEARFEGVDLFLSAPHVAIDSTEEDITRLAEKIAQRNLIVGSLVAPVWTPTGGGSAMGDAEERRRFLQQVEKACRIGVMLRQTGIRSYGVIRIDSAAEAHGERLAAEGEICWAAMHSWRHMLELLEAVDRPATLGFQADMAHTLLYTLGFNAPEDRVLPPDFDWQDETALYQALQMVSSALRPWMIDFHVAQNDGTVKGAGSHDKTGHHCLPGDPQGRLNITRDAGLWLRDDEGRLTKSVRHICWDGCMFPNTTMAQSETWNGILKTMLAVQDAHGWSE